VTNWKRFGSKRSSLNRVIIPAFVLRDWWNGLGRDMNLAHPESG
jgi:hypothetical protein